MTSMPKISADQACILVGQLALQERTNDLKDTGTDIEAARKAQSAAHDSLKALSKEAQDIADHQEHGLLHRGAAQALWGFFGGETDASRKAKALETNAAAAEKMQTFYAAKKDHLKQLQNDAKDIHETYDASTQVYQEMIQELDDASSAITS